MGPVLIIAWLLTLGLCGVGLGLRARLVKAARQFQARPASPNDSATALSVIIPARDEAHNLPALLHSLTAQSRPPDEIIVVDDGSTDGTAEIARELGATVMASGDLPEGWRGKTWACHQGAQKASGNLLLFLDADTWFEPGGLARILAGYEGGALSVGPHHVIARAYENLSLFFNLNMALGTVPGGLFGQMLLVDRETYLKVGGHESVKGRILENFRLAAQFHALGLPVRSLPGRGLFAFRMYPNGARELIAGWTKGFASGAGQTPRAILLRVVLWMIGLMLAPIAWLVTGDTLAWGPLYLLGAALVWGCGRQVGCFHWWSAAAYPGPLLFFFAVFAGAVRRSGRAVNWKGREIRAD